MACGREGKCDVRLYEGRWLLKRSQLVPGSSCCLMIGASELPNVAARVPMTSCQPSPTDRNIRVCVLRQVWAGRDIVRVAAALGRERES